MVMCPACKDNEADGRCRDCNKEFCGFCLTRFHLSSGKEKTFCKTCARKLPKCGKCGEARPEQKCQRCD